ncbi:hypothetical protein HGB07_04705 [Candidatus Roizmanbacteria bacterium]|nr:hypothetical protein [Candidatus Roizmanbacteria bacterium]
MSEKYTDYEKNKHNTHERLRLIGNIGWRATLAAGSTYLGILAYNYMADRDARALQNIHRDDPPAVVGLYPENATLLVIPGMQCYDDINLRAEPTTESPILGSKAGCVYSGAAVENSKEEIWYALYRQLPAEPEEKVYVKDMSGRTPVECRVTGKGTCELTENHTPIHFTDTIIPK